MSLKDKLAAQYRKANRQVVPDPFCPRCKGTGRVEKFSYHNGDPYDTACDCVKEQKRQNESEREKLAELLVDNAVEIIRRLS